MAALTRRQFLRSGSGLLLGLGLGQLLVPGCGTDTLPVTTAPVPAGQPPWAELAAALRGQLLRPGQAGYAQAAAPWNLRFTAIQPQGVARCTSVEDVRAALAWAEANQVPLVVRSGGHSYAGYSTNTGLMIDLTQMNSVAYDPATGRAVLGGGARNADVYANLRAPGVAVTHGRCKAVGVAGLVLGGGIGFNMRLHGLTCDGLVETEVVTADGQVRRCNDQENADLFWACRGGGGGNFGIHTSFTFQTFPVDTLTVFSIAWTANPRAVFQALLDFCAAAPDTLGAKVSLVVLPGTGNAVQVQLLGQLVGSPGELAAMLGPVYQVAAPSQETIFPTDYWNGQDFLSEEGVPAYVHERSRYVFAPLSEEAVDTLFAFLSRWPGTGAEANWKFFLQGGAVARVAPEATAFVHRQALMISSIELDWTAADSPQTIAANEAWLDEFHQAMEPFTSRQSFQNFIDGSEQDYLRAYYGGNLERLVQVKAACDPGNVFHFPQSIPLSLA